MTDPHREDVTPSKSELTRRQALATLLGLGCISLLPACRTPRRDEAAGGQKFTGERRDTLAAAVERIFPGAVAAGALDFFERLFTDRAFVGVGQQFAAATVVLNRLARSRNGSPFAACSPADQDALLLACRDGQVANRSFDGKLFFKRLVVLTLESFLGDPRHGGNRDEVGWKLIGHEACHYVPRRLELVTHPERGLPY